MDKQGFLDDHQVGQGEQGVQLRGVLGQAAIAQLLMAKQVLDDMDPDSPYVDGPLLARCFTAL